jgi:hypothetical protein
VTKYFCDRFNFIESAPSILERFCDPLPDKLRPGIPMNDFWSNWLEAVRFTCEAEGVISARLMLFASGAPNAADEAARMISEKVVAFADAGIAADRALKGGLGLYAAAERAYSPLKRCVHANSDRLTSAMH